MSSIPKVTLDTNCIINLFDRSAQTPTSVDGLPELFRRALSHQIDLAITTRVESDLLNDRDPERKAEMLRILDLLPVIATVGSVGRFDVSTWDNGDVFGGADTSKLEANIRGVLFPGLTEADRRFLNKISDVDHLLGHSINRRDIFVTDDGRILGRSEVLLTLGIHVLSPSECLMFLDDLQSRMKTAPLHATHSDPQFQSAAFKGTVTFDYSNNNGHFSIGDGIRLFETSWSKASDNSIHAYSGMPSIGGIALAKVANEFSDLQDITKLDYSSRVRTPRVGQIDSTFKMAATHHLP